MTAVAYRSPPKRLYIASPFVSTSLVSLRSAIDSIRNRNLNEVAIIKFIGIVSCREHEKFKLESFSIF